MKLLIVEDNPVNLKLMKILTKHLEFDEVLYAKNGREAVEICKLAKPEILLCDIQMPIMDGIQVLQYLREDPELSKTVVIAVTAHAMVGEKERLLSLGFDAYMSKPLDTRLLRDELIKFQKVIVERG